MVDRYHNMNCISSLTCFLLKPVCGTLMTPLLLWGYDFLILLFLFFRCRSHNSCILCLENIFCYRESDPNLRIKRSWDVALGPIKQVWKLTVSFSHCQLYKYCLLVQYCKSISIRDGFHRCCGTGARGAVIKLPPGAGARALITNYGSGSLLFYKRLEEIL